MRRFFILRIDFWISWRPFNVQSVKFKKGKWGLAVFMHRWVSPGILSWSYKQCFMKKFFFSLILCMLFSFAGSAQSPRKCGCKTWRQWSSSIPKKEGESRWKRRHLYDVYLNECITECRKKLIKEQQKK